MQASTAYTGIAPIMLSNIARTFIAATALSPILLTWALIAVDREDKGDYEGPLLALALALSIILICMVILRLAEKKLTKITFSCEEVKSIDNESIAYVVTYLLPLVSPPENLSITVQLLVFSILIALLSLSHAFSFNPILSALNYHFYEIKEKSGTSYMLISKQNITDKKSIKTVGRLSNFLLIDLS